ncbi:rhodanese-like domain-containing protein [Aequorivita antarctica]|uniref:Rhodanese-like domain-containing protein n=1 Tax=Aequorivita antarctica TaxID=153266 RepID=A0A5C6YYS4_9FLAO|nr:rhodanese-like domain-containing protein [Aequorivita antarctica]TXD72302.1 rhodanese-like domain-containing protein [Aequorivita antarctica]SRX74438.1 putative adenylyltransferase/sulfurtransferase MoeZ [Aequorivita antarctica]
MADLTQQQWSEQCEKDDNAVILDVRTDAEFDEGYIPGALQIDIFNGAEFLKRAKALDPEKNYYVYCRSGGRSGQACMLLNSIGVKNAYNLKGGIIEWKGEINN